MGGLCPRAECLVPEPAVKGFGAFAAGAVDRAVGPAAEEGADEAFYFAVGSGSWNFRTAAAAKLRPRSPA
jgi:hypothetical protein